MCLRDRSEEGGGGGGGGWSLNYSNCCATAGLHAYAAGGSRTDQIMFEALHTARLLNS